MTDPTQPETRIYIDESGTHGEQWLVIGALIVPSHGPLHSKLIGVKEDKKYYNRSPKRAAKYKETHLAEFKSGRDVEVARDWVDIFLNGTAYFRSIVVDWSIWQGRHFGDPFEPDALKKRRAYKKWAEMLLHPEVSIFRGAGLYLDRLRISYGYDVLDHLKERFTGNYKGADPWISKFQHTDSWRDANQCLQLCDLLVGCVYQSLVPAERSEYKRQAVEHLVEKLKPLGIRELTPRFWRGYDKKTLTKHFPKFSEWFWKPGQ